MAKIDDFEVGVSLEHAGLLHKENLQEIRKLAPMIWSDWCFPFL